MLEKLRELTGTQERILVIDDDERARYLLKQQFRELQCRDPGGLRRAGGDSRGRQRRPDVIILDLSDARDERI